MKYGRKSVMVIVCCTMLVSGTAGINAGVADAKISGTKKSDIKKVAVKKLDMKVSDTHKLPTFNKKKYAYKCSKCKIVSVSKNGMLKALKKGKCIVTVLKNNKEYKKYSVVVKDTSGDNELKASKEQIQATQISTTVPSTTPVFVPTTPPSTSSTLEPGSTEIPAPGGILASCQGTIAEITQISEDKYQYKIKISSDSYGSDYLAAQGVAFEAVTCGLSSRKVGDYAFIIYNARYGSQIVGDTIYYNSGSVGY